MKVEQLEGFFESGREFILWRILRRRARPPSRVCEELAFGVVDGDHDAAIHAAARAESEAELADGFRRQFAFGQIRMRAFEVLKLETEGLVQARLGRIVTNWFRLRRAYPELRAIVTVMQRAGATEAVA